MSVVSLPKYPIPGLEHLDPEEAALRLHNKKNQAVRPDEDMVFPPYKFRPFPVALYRDWDPANRRREVVRIANKAGVRLDDERQMQLIEDEIVEWETMQVGVHDYDENDDIVSALRERNERELAARLDAEWCSHPSELRAKKDQLNKRVALNAALRAGDDRHLGEQAQRELDAIEEAADDHVVEVPEVRRGPGRPRKVIEQ